MSPAGFLAAGNGFVTGYLGLALALDWLDVNDAWVWLVVAGVANFVLVVASWRGEL